MISYFSCVLILMYSGLTVGGSLDDCLERISVGGALGKVAHAGPGTDTRAVARHTALIVSDDNARPDFFDCFGSRIDTFLLTAESAPEEIVNELAELRERGAGWDPKTRFVIAIRGPGFGVFDVRQLCFLLWRFGAVDFVLLLNAGGRGFRFYTLFPFNRQNGCMTEQASLTFLGNCSDKDAWTADEVFPEKLPQASFPDCTVVVSSIPLSPYLISSRGVSDPYDDGVEFRLGELIARRSGLFLNWSKPETDAKFHGMLLNNGVWTDALGKLQRGGADLALGGYTQTWQRALAFRLSVPYGYNSFAFYVPSAGRKAPWEILDSSIFIPVVAVYLIVSVCFWAMSDYGPGTSFFDVFRIGIGQPAWITPGRPCLRILFVFWALYQLNVNSIYLSSLAQAVFKSAQSANISSLEEVKARGLTTCMRSSLFRDRRTFNTGMFEESWVCDDLQSAALTLDRYGNFSILCDEDVMDLVRTRNGPLAIHKLKQVLVTRYNCFIFSRQTPYADRFDRFIRLSFEAGLIQKIFSEVQVAHTQQKREKREQTQRTHSIVYYSRMVLLPGWLCSTLGLALEIFARHFSPYIRGILNRRKINRRRRNLTKRRPFVL